MKQRHPSICRSGSESGSALVAALVLIFSASMLTMAVLAISQTATLDIRAHTQLQRSAYINEGVSNRIQWLIAADKHLFPGTSPGEIEYLDYDHDRYLPDGVHHVMDYYGTPVAFRIFSGVSGWDLNPDAYQDTLRRFTSRIDVDTTVTDAVEELTDKLRDYFDNDDELSTNGMEVDDYDAEAMAPLPRNRSSGFWREELFYIKGLTALFPPDRYGRLSGQRLPNTPRGNPNFFTASSLMLQIYCNLEESQAEEVIAAREVWFRERIQIKDQIDTLLYSSLGSLSWNDSDTYTVLIEGPREAKQPSRRLVFTYRGFPPTGPTDNMVEFLEWTFF